MDAVSQEKRLAEVIIFGILTVGFLVTLFLVYYVVGYDGSKSKDSDKKKKFNFNFFLKKTF